MKRRRELAQLPGRYFVYDRAAKIKIKGSGRREKSLSSRKPPVCKIGNAVAHKMGGWRSRATTSVSSFQAVKIDGQQVGAH